MNRLYRRALLLAVLAICSMSALAAGETYSVNVRFSDYQFSVINGYNRIESADANYVQNPGEPDLPSMTFNYLIPTNRKAIGVKILKVDLEPVPGMFNIMPAKAPIRSEVEAESIQPSPGIYESQQEYPGKILMFSHTGYFRGHQVASIIVYPFQYRPAERNLSFYSHIEFEFIFAEESFETDIEQRWDANTVSALSGMVTNKELLVAKSVCNESIATEAASYPADSIPYLIITTDELELGVFDNFADYKFKQGINLEVVPMWQITNGLMYEANTIQERIRNCIKRYYNCFHTEYVLLAGGYGNIPSAHVVTMGDTVPTDQLYSCLDGSWNQDGDTLFAEIGDDGEIDVVPDVYIGRIPCETPAEAQYAINKILVYECPVADPGYVARSLFTSTFLFDEYDGKVMNQNLISLLPQNFTVTEYYNQDSTTVKQAITTGCGILVNCSHAQNAGNFCTLWRPPLNPPGLRQTIEHIFFDTLHTVRYPIFFNRTCQYDYLETPQSIARSFMLSPNGGGVGYISPSTYEWPHNMFYHNMFRAIFNDGVYHLGKVMADAKIVYGPYCTSDNNGRTAFLTYNYLGDPHLEIWTAQPAALTVTGPDSLQKGYRTFDITVTSGGTPVGDAFVCLSKYDKSIFAVAYTDANGVAHFSNIYLPTGSYPYVTAYAKKHNYISSEKVIGIYTPLGGGGCPFLYVGTKAGYTFVNNIMPESETNLHKGENVRDRYPVYEVPPSLSGRLSFRILEEEKEESYIDKISVYAIAYPSDTQVVFTHKNEFHHRLSGTIAPTAAVDQNGNDILAQISALDGQAYESDGPGFMTVTYDLPAEYKKPLGDNPGGGFDPGDPNKNMWKPVAGEGDPFKPGMVTLSALNASNTWEDIEIRYPRLKASNYLVDLSDHFVDGRLTVRLQWDTRIRIDALPFSFFDPEPIPLEKLQLIQATHSLGGDVTEMLTASDRQEAIITPGQYVDLEFGYIRPQINHVVAAAVEFEGRYQRYDKSGTGDVVFEQNYPNPFNLSTSLTFSLSTQKQVTIEIFNILGEKVKTLADDQFSAGRHIVSWDGNDGNGQTVASGIYFCRFTAGDYSQTRKMVLMK